MIDDSIGYPVAIKAAGGGGGKGFRVAESEDELEKAFEGAAREGEKFFSDATVYIERYLPDPRHVEVQVLADAHGNVVHLFERDCSVQRRHQKLIEESPAPAVDPELRERIGKIGTEAARAVGYRSAGTIEGLLQDGEYFFLEMNTRVQVEHCVTEMVTGIDIVREQIRVAAGEPLAFKQEDVVIRGHAIECRINAEDASKNFAPAPGAIGSYREPSGPGRARGLRRRGGLRRAAALRPDDRQADRLGRGPRGLHPAHAARARRVRDRRAEDADPVPPRAARHRSVAGGRDLPRPRGGQGVAEAAGLRRRPPAADADGEEPKVERSYAVEVSGKRFDVRVIGEAAGERRRAGGRGQAPGAQAQRAREGRWRRRRRARVSPLQGTVLKVEVEKGASVEEGALICVIEAMKMENEITAPVGGTVEELGVAAGRLDLDRRHDRRHQVVRWPVTGMG